MARARNIKPSFFKSEQVADCTPYARLLFIGLWTLADRRGRLEDRPRTIKAELLPFDGEQDCHTLLQELHNTGLIIRYEVGGSGYIWIPAFEKHQNPHTKEGESELPEYKQESTSTIQAPDLHRTSPADSPILIPDSPLPHTDSIKADAPRGKYAFKGETFNVTYEDMEKLVKDHPNIYVLPHLKGIDKTYAEKKARGESIKGVWFAVRGALVNADRQARAEKGEVAL